VNLNNIDNSMLIGDPSPPDCAEDRIDRRRRLRGNCEAFDREAEDCEVDGQDCLYRDCACPMGKF